MNAIYNKNQDIINYLTTYPLKLISRLKMYYPSQFFMCGGPWSTTLNLHLQQVSWY